MTRAAPLRRLSPILLSVLALLTPAAVVVFLAGLFGSGPLVEVQTGENFTVGISSGASALNENAGQTEITVDLVLPTSLDTDTTVSVQHKHGAADYSFMGDW